VASGVTAIAAGNAHSLFLKSDGSLWAMGINTFGQLGDGTNVATNRPEQIVSNDVVALAAGQQHSFFIKSDGSLWAMGRNLEGELGDGTYASNPPAGTNRPEQIVTSSVMAVAGGWTHSLFSKNDGSLWAMGQNIGQLGDGTVNWQNRPELIVGYNVMAVAAGRDHSLFLKNDGSLWGMGDSEAGQLGDGTYNHTNRPEQIVAGPPGYNQVSIQVLSSGNVRLSFVGIAAANYALDRSLTLTPVNWTPVATNAAGLGGALVFTNSPDLTTQNFWRIRSLP
jgi:alpha-tubulin suppressor-like RCC1 family protein